MYAAITDQCGLMTAPPRLSHNYQNYQLLDGIVKLDVVSLAAIHLVGDIRTTGSIKKNITTKTQRLQEEE
jgi:hypothetical protein